MGICYDFESVGQGSEALQQTQYICITFIKCWFSVEDVWPTLHKCYTKVLCLLGQRQMGT